MKLTLDQLRWLRMRAQRLILPSEVIKATPESVLEAVTGLQAQDLPSALLGVRVRSQGLTEAGPPGRAPGTGAAGSRLDAARHPAPAQRSRRGLAAALAGADLHRRRPAQDGRTGLGRSHGCPRA